MPLGLLVALVVFGIAGTAILTHLFGYSRPFRIDSDETAARQWLRHWPDDRIRGIRRSADGQAALIDSSQGAGLLWSLGADTTARRIAGATPSPCRRGLRLDLHDFTAPHVTVALSADEARAWIDEIERMKCS